LISAVFDPPPEHLQLPSTIVEHIRRLEADLNAALIIRTRRHARPTSETIGSTIAGWASLEATKLSMADFSSVNRSSMKWRAQDLKRSLKQPPISGDVVSVRVQSVDLLINHREEGEG